MSKTEDSGSLSQSQKKNQLLQLQQSLSDSQQPSQQTDDNNNSTNNNNKDQSTLNNNNSNNSNSNNNNNNNNSNNNNNNKRRPERLVPRETYPVGKESTLYAHLELGSASVESLIHFNERAQDPQFVEAKKEKEAQAAVNKAAIQVGNETSAGDKAAVLAAAAAAAVAEASEVIHPAFVQLGMDYATGTIIGTYRRCHAFLEALCAFLGDMRPRDGSRLADRLITYINSVVRYLGDCRQNPLPLDNIISKCQDIIDQASRQFDNQRDCIREVKNRVIEYMEELEYQQEETVSASQKHLKDGDVVLTFGHSEVVVNTLLEAQSRGLVIKVIVVDSKPLLEGKKTLHTLTLNRFECEYALVTALQYIIPQVSKVLLGAHAVLSNGALLARSGSALTALCAKRANKPVLVCCESFKFVKQAYIDSICYNELGPPTNILLDQSQQSQVQERVFSTPLRTTTTAIEDGAEPINTKAPLSLHSTTVGSQNERALANWLKIDNLKLLNLRFDLTPANYISALITNYDTIPPSSASVVFRETSKRRPRPPNDGKQSIVFQ